MAWLGIPHLPKAVFVLGAHSPSAYSPACAQSLLFPKRKKKPRIKYSSTLLSFFQKARTVRNAKRHFAFGEKTFALKVRVALMNIYSHSP
ncbi:hypothetical protein D4R42_03140 [bacterium]|nr:MAG: hypothetical protein D4R42_03140 [bacterium]